MLPLRPLQLRQQLLHPMLQPLQLWGPPVHLGLVLCRLHLQLPLQTLKQQPGGRQVVSGVSGQAVAGMQQQLGSAGRL